MNMAVIILGSEQDSTLDEYDSNCT